jgi:hypothetical protein
MASLSGLLGGGSAIKSQQTLSITPADTPLGTFTFTISTVSDIDKCHITATVFPTGPHATSAIYGATVSGFGWIGTIREQAQNSSAHWRLTSTSVLTYRANANAMNGAYITITEYE